MKILLFILISFAICTCCYFFGEFLGRLYDKLYDRWLYNKGVCRNCKNKYSYITSHGGYILYECPNCHRLILIKSNDLNIKA